MRAEFSEVGFTRRSMSSAGGRGSATQPQARQQRRIPPPHRQGDELGPHLLRRAREYRRLGSKVAASLAVFFESWSVRRVIHKRSTGARRYAPDMVSGRTVAHITCEHCGRCVKLEERRFAALPVGVRLRQRLRCTGCGHRGAQISLVWQEGAPPANVVRLTPRVSEGTL